MAEIEERVLRDASDRAELDGEILALLVIDDDCRCLEATGDACRLLGVEREELLGVALGELLTEDARERFAHVWRGFRGRGGHAGPFRIDAAGSPEVDLRVTAEVLPSRHLVFLSPGRTRRWAGAGEWNGSVPPSLSGLHRDQPAPSSRERQILRMLAGGATDGQIAERLALSPATVRTHVRNAKAKLGASTRAQAVALALGRGLIEPG